MKERLYPRATVTPKGEKSLRGGHPWIYADEVTSLSAAPADGGLVDVYSEKDRYLGTGFYNSHSKIRVRILSRNTNDTFDGAYWERRLGYAVAYRRTVMGETDFRCCRLIFGEADGFPGLTVDRFENVLVAQVLSLGIENVEPVPPCQLPLHGEGSAAVFVVDVVAVEPTEKPLLEPEFHIDTSLYLQYSAKEAAAQVYFLPFRCNLWLIRRGAYVRYKT